VRKETIARKKIDENHDTKKATNERIGEKAGTRKVIRKRSTGVSTVERKARRECKKT